MQFKYRLSIVGKIKYNREKDGEYLGSLEIGYNMKSITYINTEKALPMYKMVFKNILAVWFRIPLK